MDAMQVLRGVEALRGLPEPEMEKAVGSSRMAHLQAGQHFYHQGQQVHDFAIVATGTLRVYRVGESGREITLYHVGAGQPCLVNMLGALLGQTACASAQAQDSVDALLLPQAVARDWMRANEAFRDFVLDSMGRRLLDVMTLIEEIAFRRMDQRLQAYLQRRFAGAARIEVTHEAIAAELGTAREVVSRLLEALAREGAVELGHGWIRAKDFPRPQPADRLVT